MVGADETRIERSRTGWHPGEHGRAGLLRTADASSATPEAVVNMVAGFTLLRRVTMLAEFADATVFFLSPWLVVDGGLVKG
jgi:3-oxoacyl-[acyl-carrier protein] reductase